MSVRLPMVIRNLALAPPAGNDHRAWCRVPSPCGTTRLLVVVVSK